MLEITASFVGGKGLFALRELFSDQLCKCVNMIFGYLCCRCVGNTSR